MNSVLIGNALHAEFGKNAFFFEESTCKPLPNIFYQAQRKLFAKKLNLKLFSPCPF